MKITSIKQQVKIPDRASIFIDSKYAFSLSLNELVAEKLKIGQEIEEPDLKRLKKLSEDGKLKARAMEWVMTRPRSIREFKDYLRRKKVDDSLSEFLANDFIERKWIDEASFTKWFTDVLRRRGKSERAIIAELYKKGISREVMDQAYARDNVSERDRLELLVSKKLKLTRYKNDPNKLKQLLLRQGFSYDSINEALGERTSWSE